MTKAEETYKHPRAASAFHHIFGPPVACAVALSDAISEARQVYRRNYKAIRSWHADKIDQEDN